MSKKTREIYYECFNGDMKTMMDVLWELEKMHNHSTQNQMRIAAITETYCERFKEKAEVEIIDITFTNKYDLRIIVKIIDNKNDKVIITDIIDNIKLPLMYINSTTSYNSIKFRQEVISHSLFYNNPQYCRYYASIAEATYEFIVEHFSYVQNVVQLVSNKRYVKLTYGGI